VIGLRYREHGDLAGAHDALGDAADQEVRSIFCSSANREISSCGRPNRMNFAGSTPSLARRAAMSSRCVCALRSANSFTLSGAPSPGTIADSGESW
jgi:hypothetical protein